MKKHFITLIFLSFITDAEIKEHQGLLATLFVQSSAEFYTNSVSVYKSAEYQLESAIKDLSYSAAIEQTKDFSESTRYYNMSLSKHHPSNTL